MSLSIGNLGPSADFSVSSSESVLQIAQVLQTILDSLVPGTTVTWEAYGQTPTNAAFPYQFLVTFPGNEAEIVVSGPSDTLLSPLTPTPSVTMLGQSSPVPDIVEEVYGWYGSPQYGASIAETSSGSFVEVWNDAALTNDATWTATNLYFRTFQESTDTAGPLVTDFIDPYSGGPIQDGQTITDQMNCVVVTFDSDMMTTGPNSVTNPSDWALLLNGNLVTNGIGTIYYGMNEAALNPLFASLHAPATNKWQAVIMLNGQGSNQGGTTATYLQDGHYQLVATTALEDQAGNALARTGFQPNGVQYSRSFNIVLPSKGETLVNTGNTTGNQITSEPNTQATASDANGDYVVVWSGAPGQNLTFALSNAGRRRLFPPWSSTARTPATSISTRPTWPPRPPTSRRRWPPSKPARP